MTVAKARAALRRAIDRACIARGEALWTNGYRAGRYTFNEAEDARLYKKEMGQLGMCTVAELSVERAIKAYARALRAEKAKRR